MEITVTKFPHCILAVQRGSFLHANCTPYSSSSNVRSYVPVSKISFSTDSHRDANSSDLICGK